MSPRSNKESSNLCRVTTIASLVLGVDMCTAIMEYMNHMNLVVFFVGMRDDQTALMMDGT